MQDMLIKANNEGLYDLVFEGQDFASALGFESAIPVSFFTDARATAVQVPNAQRRRGWVGNILTVEQERELGGLLWILDQARITNDTINIAQAYTQGSLHWMLEDDIARFITIVVEKNNDRSINILTDITTIDNTVQRYVTLWRSTDLTRIL